MSASFDLFCDGFYIGKCVLPFAAMGLKAKTTGGKAPINYSAVPVSVTVPINSNVLGPRTCEMAMKIQ